MYVMEHYHLSWEDALHMVQNRRYCISPNGGFLTQIKVRLKFDVFTRETTAIAGIRSYIQGKLGASRISNPPARSIPTEEIRRRRR